MEAMCAGLPVISTKHGGIVDIIEENKTGFLVAENDTDNMAEHLIVLLKNPEKALTMGEAASEFIMSNHTLAAYTQRLWDVIKNAKK
jgi:glycosyltransferase involved in cell wall biosynthesis